MRSLSTCEARNTRTRRGRIGTSSPVFGLRPMRWPFCRTKKLPKDEILTVSPRDSASEISSQHRLDQIRRIRCATARPPGRPPRSAVPALPWCPRHRFPRGSSVARVMPDRRKAVNYRGMRTCRSHGIGADTLRIALWPAAGGSPAEQRRAPGEAAAHRLQQDEMAGPDAAVADRPRRAPAGSRRPRYWRGDRR